MMVTPLTKAIHDTETNLTKKETGSCTFSNKQPTILSDPERPYRPVGKLRLDLHPNFIDAFCVVLCIFIHFVRFVIQIREIVGYSFVGSCSLLVFEIFFTNFAALAFE